MSLADLLDRLAAFEPDTVPVVSLYLNLQPDQHGRDNYRAFLRKELPNRLKTWAPRSPERQSLESDMEQINKYLSHELEPSSNGLAIFSCSARGLFEAVQLEAPVEAHRLYIGYQPHLYPLARLDDRYPRYAAVVADTNLARVLVFSTGRLVSETTVESDKTNRSQMGGWAQARYQRHVDHTHVRHVKDVVEVLETVTRNENIRHIILSGDEVVVPLLREQLPPQLQERIVDVLRLPVDAPEREVLTGTLESLRQRDVETDQQRVEALIGAYRSGGLGVVGPRETLEALSNGQVDELIIDAALDGSNAALDGSPTAPSGDETESEPERLTEAIADELVTRAKQTSARVTFIEDAGLLRPYGGVGAMLRFRI
jgi:peptide chain release factor subunit 1